MKKYIEPHLETEAFDRIHTVKTLIEILLGFGEEVHPAIKHYGLEQDVTNAARVVANLHTKLATKIESEKIDLDFSDDYSREVLLTEDAFDSIVDEIGNSSESYGNFLELMREDWS